MNPYQADIPLAADHIGRIRTISEITASLQWAMQNKSRPEVQQTSSQLSAWNGTDTPQEYIDMLRDGWDAGVEGVEGLDGLSSDAMTQLAWTHEVAGAVPVIPRCISGHPQRMLRPIQAAQSKRGLTLIIDGTYNGSVEPDTVLEYAQTVMRLLAWLAAERIETAVYAAGTTSQRRKRYTYLVQVRASGDVMQPERIATILHPAYLRRAMFAQREREKNQYKMATSIAGSNYGSSQTTNPKHIARMVDECYSVVMLPKVGCGDPTKAVHEALNFKLQHKDVQL